MSRWELLAVMVFLVFIPMLAGLAVLDHNRAEGLKRETRRSNVQLAASQAQDAWSRYDDAINACVRGRELREQQNANNEIIGRLAFIVANVLSDGAIDQLEGGSPGRAAELRASRDQITAAALRLRPLTQPVCSKVIKLPAVPRPGS